MELMTIGELARQCRLSLKALRLYDELGVLRPAHVDPATSYRLYEPGQLAQARLVAGLRQLGMPLAEVKDVVALDPVAAADRLERFWAEAEAGHAGRRQLAGFLVARLRGEEKALMEVTTRSVPERHVLCLHRHVEGHAGAWALGKEFMGILRAHRLPQVEGRTGATFCIFHGEVSDESDGPLEWCRPVPAAEAEAAAAAVPELALRIEPAHEEAVVHLEHYAVDSATQELMSESLRTWAEDQHRRPSELGVRMTYLAVPPITETSEPDCDFAVPLA